MSNDKNEAPVYVTIIRKPTVEVLKNITDDLKRKNRRLVRQLKEKLSAERREGPFNGIKGIEALAHVKVKP